MARITVGITGASGGLYARRLLRSLLASDQLDGVDLVVSGNGRIALHEELDLSRDGPLDLEELVGIPSDKLRLHSNK